MRGPHWKRAPWLFLSCLCSCLWLMVLGTVSAGTSTSDKTTTSFLTSVSNTPSATSEVLTTATSTDSTTGTMADTSQQVTGSLCPVTSGVAKTTKTGQSTLPFASTSTQESSAFTQTHETQSMETTSESQSSTVTEGTTSSISMSQSSHALTQTMRQTTFPTGETSTSSPSSASNRSRVTSQVLTTTTASDSTPKTPGGTLLPVTGSPFPVTSGVSVTTQLGQSTLPLVSTSSQESSPFSQTQKIHSMETTGDSRITTLTEVTTSSLTSSPSGHTLTETLSLGTSPPGETTTLSPLAISNNPPATSEVLTTATFMDSTPGNMGDTSLAVTQSVSLGTSVVIMTTGPGQATLSSVSTSTQETSAFSHTQQTQNKEATSEPQSSTPTEATTAILSSSSRGHTLTEALSLGTSLSGETTTSTPASVSNTPSEVLTIATSTDSTTGTVGDTSQLITGSLSPVTSGVAMTTKPGQSTLPFASTSTQESSAFSQTHETQSMETTSESQSSTVTEATTSSISMSQSGHALTQTVRQTTFLTGETSTYPSSVSNSSPVTSQVLTTTSATDSTLKNMGDTSLPVTGSPSPVTSGVSVTTQLGQSTFSFVSTSSQESSAFSQTQDTHSMETIGDSRITTITEATASSLTSSPSGHMLTETLSLGTSPPGETTTSSPTSVSNTPSATSEVLTMGTSTDSTTGTMGDTSQQVTGSLCPVTSGVAKTTKPGQSTLPFASTSTQESPAFSQTQETQSMETTGETQSSTVTEATTSSISMSQSGHALTQTMRQTTFPTGETSTSSPSSVNGSAPVTSQELTTTTASDSTLKNPGDTLLPVTGSSFPVTSGVSVTTQLGQSTPSFVSTSSQESSPFSQTQKIHSMETTGDSRITTLTEVTTSSLTSSPSGHTLTETLSLGTFPPGETTTSSPPAISNNPPATSGMLTTATSMDSTPGNMGDTSLAVTQSVSLGTSVVIMTTGPGQATLSSVSTSTQETSAFSHTQQTQNKEATSEPQSSTPTEATTAILSSSPRGHTLTEALSLGTSLSGETTTSSPASVSNTPKEVLTIATSTDSTTGTVGDTSQLITGSLSPVTSGVAMTTKPGQSTLPFASTSTQESSAFSQTHETQSMETTSESQSSTITEVTTSSFSSSQGGHTLTQTVRQTTFPTGETSTYPSSVSNSSPVTSQVLTTTSATDSTLKNTGDTSLPVTGSPSPVTSGVSVTTQLGQSTFSFVSTSSQESSAFSQTQDTHSMETTGDSRITTITEATASSLTSSPSGHTLTETLSLGTFPPGETTTSSPARVSNTPSATSEVLTTATSTDSTTGTMGDTSQQVTGSLCPVTSGVAKTTKPGQSTLPFASTSTQESSAFSQTHETQSMETTGETQSSTVTEATTSSISMSQSGHALTQTMRQTTFPTGETSTSSPSSASNRSPITSQELTTTTATDSTLKNTGDTSLPVTGSLPPVTSGVSVTTQLGQSTLSFVSTSSQESSPFSQTQKIHSMETTGDSRITTLTEVTTSSLTSSPSGHMLTETFPLGTFPPGETTTSSPASVSNTPSATSEVLTMATSTDSNTGTMGDTSQQFTGSLSPVTSGGSMTAGPGQSTLPFVSISTQESSVFSQTHQTQSMETTSESQISTLTEGTVSILSVFPSGHTPTEVFSPGPSSAGMITTSLGTDSGRSTVTSSPSTTSLTHATSTPSTSPGSSSTAPPDPVSPEEGVSLFPYGSSAGDLQLFDRTADFTSKVFKIQIGFPFGSSLRDSLYFTDNGQIIFPESDYQIFSYPNPPLRGFTGWDSVAIVAPFWGDADFSSHRGTIFYQEYETLYDENNPLVKKVETWIRKFTNVWSYKARWTLKVTWANALAYPAQWTFGTNTYQAILSTDGSRSYALFLYQSGGMQWDVTQRPHNSVLMGFSSADGYFENSPLTFRPVQEKYRPDRFLNSKLGLRGLQVYRLHRDERPNYRLKCLGWLRSRPQWPSWGWSQIPCPCSWQQGQWDLRFQPISIGHGSRRLCSFSSWRGGVCCSYGPWGEFQEGWSVQSPWQFDQELEGQNWCCHWNNKPFFCALYQQRRPHISCAGYRPPRPAWMFGDPHIVTLDDANYTFNGLGDFLLIRAWGGNSSFQLQGRTAQTGSARATNFIAFAAQYSFGSQVPSMVQWFLNPMDTIRVLHNNQSVTFETNRTDAAGLEIFNTTGVLLTQNGSQVSASFDGTVTISVTALSNILHASASLPEEYRGRTEGLLGVWNDNPEDDFRMPNGSTLPRDSSEERLFHYGMTWQINGTGLLGKRMDPLPSNFTPVFFSQLLKNKSQDDEELVSGCKGDEQCIYDTLATRNASTGLGTRTMFRTHRQMNATLNQYPPSIHNCSELAAYKGQTKRIQCTSNSENITFTLGNNCTGFQLFGCPILVQAQAGLPFGFSSGGNDLPFCGFPSIIKNGTLLWTPNFLKPCTLEIIATNTEVRLSSALQPRTVACFCQTDSQCLYNETSWVGNSSLEVASCRCDGDTFGLYCERSKDPCDEPCFPNVTCIPGSGCEACPMDMTGDGRHCARPSVLQDSVLCQNYSCPENYCYNHGHCFLSGTLGCQPTCTCPPAFTDTRCLVAGNNFTPTILRELPLRTIRLLLREEENASEADVNASVAYRLGTLDMRAFLRNSLVKSISPPVPALGRSLQHWVVISQFQYRPRGPVIHFLNHQLRDAVVEAFLLQASRGRRERSKGPRNDVVFHPISRGDVQDEAALNMSMLDTYFKCDGYEHYRLVYSPQSGVTCVSPCSEGHCHHGGQCQHLPDGPRCSCVSFAIYTAWGEHCEHLSMKLSVFFGILFGALGALLLVVIVAFVVLRFCGCTAPKVSYLLDSEH